MSVRARAAERLSIERRPRLHAPFELAAPLLTVGACEALVAEDGEVSCISPDMTAKKVRFNPILIRF